jgi:protein-S-isoprenylcysteine O-methyltransferase Ste14
MLSALQFTIAAAPLIGWGLGDVHGFAASPARLAVLVVAVASSALLARQSARLNPFARGPGRQDAAASRLLMLGVLSVPLALAWFAFADRREILVVRDDVPVRVAGVMMYAAGEGVRVVALRALGRQYSAWVTLQSGHVLVRRGIYGFVRHPMYLAQTLAVPGVALAYRSLLAGPVLILSVLFVRRRVRREEELLARAFPAEFDEYRRVTWRFVPFVY